jgi:F0F1-type ATP synthase alpha subunit
MCSLPQTLHNSPQKPPIDLTFSLSKVAKSQQTRQISNMGTPVSKVLIIHTQQFALPLSPLQTSG